MKIIMIGTTTDNKRKEMELTIEYAGDTEWNLKMGTREFVVSDLEKAINFLKREAK